jgi:hypothetical protein
MNTAFSLNWVVNHKFVVTAMYYAQSTPTNVQSIVEPDSSSGTSIRLIHQFAGLGFGYILFSNKRFSFQPELIGGWGGAKFTTSGVTFRRDFAEVIPAVYGIYNACSIVRIGIGLNYRAAIGASLNGLKSADLSGVSGLVFIRVGTF